MPCLCLGCLTGISEFSLLQCVKRNLCLVNTWAYLGDPGSNSPNEMNTSFDKSRKMHKITPKINVYPQNPKPAQHFFLAMPLDEHNIKVHCIILRTRSLLTSKAPLKSQAQGTSLFTSTASNKRGCPREAQVLLPEGERMQISR